MKYQIQRGTYDAFGNEASRLEDIEMILKTVASIYGYSSIHIPTYEQTELFTRSVGESSDIVNKEMFTFLDKGGRSITLRPEMTAGTMRAVVTNKLYAQNLPLKLSYCGKVFRYERPQAGRFREFTQFGIENIGINSFYSDVETISFGYNVLKELGFPHVILKINSLGDEESRANYKLALEQYFAKHIDTMCEDCKRRFEKNVLRILDCKVKEDQEIVRLAPKMKDYLTPAAKENFQNVLNLLDEQQIEYELDDTLVRGLDYYSQVVFEYHFISSDGTNLGAIGAGGHYDHLLEEVGGPALSSVGLAFGLERINALLKELYPSDEFSYLDVFVIYVGEATKQYAFLLAQELRNNAFSVDMSFDDKSLSSQLKLAIKKNARCALIIGEEEMNSNEFTLKLLEEQKQIKVPYEDLIDVLNMDGKELEEYESKKSQ